MQFKPRGAIDHSEGACIITAQRHVIGAERIVGDRDIRDLDPGPDGGVLGHGRLSIVEGHSRGRLVHIRNRDGQGLRCGRGRAIIGLNLNGIDIAARDTARSLEIWRANEAKLIANEFKRPGIRATRNREADVFRCRIHIRGRQCHHIGAVLGDALRCIDSEDRRVVIRI